MSRTKKAARKGGGSKRKREGDDTEERPSKKVSLPQRPKQTEADEAIASMDPSLLADHFAKAVRNHYPDSSPIELEDRYLPTKAFRDTTDFNKDHIASNLPEFLEKFTENGKDTLLQCKDGTGPHTLVITSSGIRTADVARELRVFNSEDCMVAKLIAKHMKLKANVAYMKRNRVGIAISTPMRLRDLVDADALKLQDVKRIVVDGAYQDEKKRSIFELNELFGPLVELLNRVEIRQRYGTVTPVEIMVF